MLSFDDIALEYENWYYTPKGKYLSNLEKEALREIMRIKKGDTFLEVGCGTGYFSYYFNSLGLKVTGLDSSPKMLEVARTKGEEVEFILSDAHRLDFSDNSFDIVALITTLEFCKNPELALREAYRVCKREVVLGVLSKLSWMNLERKFKKKSIYKKATFYTPWGIKKLIKRSLPGVKEYRIKVPFCAFIVCRIDKRKED